MALMVKRRPASQHQLDMGKLIVEMTRGRGGDAESCAGAVATAIQESSMTNISGGDRDSQGLYQQRPSMSWGTVAQIRTPSYAVGKFLDQYLPYRRSMGWLQASHKTQRSAHASAPAQWYSEGQAFASAFGGTSGGDSGSLSLGMADGATGVQPYEFSRGTADQKEDTWVCSGRLADEVQWRRFMRAGALWYVSDDWLIKQPVAFRLSETTAGVVALSFEFETRAEAAEASLRVASRRYSVLPGDVVELIDEGPGSGKWLVREVRRNLFSQISDVSLVRKRPKLPEPAPAVMAAAVGGANASQGDFVSAGGGSPAEKAYQAAELATSFNWPYRLTQRTIVDRPPSADCSSGVSWVLWKAGIPLPGGASKGSWAPVSGAFIGWGQSGPGQYMTVMTHSGHIWIRWNGIGSAWRFDTGGGSGGKNHATARSTSGFVQRHWAGT